MQLSKKNGQNLVVTISPRLLIYWCKYTILFWNLQIARFRYISIYYTYPRPRNINGNVNKPP